MTFDAWTLRLRKNCELQDKLSAFDSMPDFALELLWKKGLAPTMKGITASIEEQKREPR